MKRRTLLLLVLILVLASCAQPQGLVWSGKVFHPTAGYETNREIGIDYVSERCPCGRCPIMKRPHNPEEYPR